MSEHSVSNMKFLYIQNTLLAPVLVLIACVLLLSVPGHSLAIKPTVKVTNAQIVDTKNKAVVLVEISIPRPESDDPSLVNVKARFKNKALKQTKIRHKYTTATKFKTVVSFKLRHFREPNTKIKLRTLRLKLKYSCLAKYKPGPTCSGETFHKKFLLEPLLANRSTRLKILSINSRNNLEYVPPPDVEWDPIVPYTLMGRKRLNSKVGLFLVTHFQLLKVEPSKSTGWTGKWIHFGNVKAFDTVEVLALAQGVKGRNSEILFRRYPVTVEN